MKYLYIPLIIILFSNSLFAQAYEEKISNLSCILIESIDTSTDINTSMKKCILKAKFDVEKEFPELKPNLSTDELRKKYTVILELLAKNCKVLATKKAAYNKNIRYIRSEN